MSPLFLDDGEEGKPKMYYDEIDVRQQLRRERKAGFWMGILTAVACVFVILVFLGWYISG